jgi:hypothetical protein
VDLDAAERLIALIHICIKNVWEMPKHAPELECSVEGKAILVALAKSRTEEAQAVERAVRFVTAAAGDWHWDV